MGSQEVKNIGDLQGIFWVRLNKRRRAWVDREERKAFHGWRMERERGSGSRARRGKCGHTEQFLPDCDSAEINTLWKVNRDSTTHKAGGLNKLEKFAYYFQNSEVHGTCYIQDPWEGLLPITKTIIKYPKKPSLWNWAFSKLLWLRNLLPLEHCSIIFRGTDVP